MDIDGCCNNLDYRWKMFQSGDWDYDRYVRSMPFDEHIPAGVAIYKAMMDAGHRCVFITARSLNQYKATFAQLKKMFEDRHFELWMPPSYEFGDKKPADADLKIQMLKERGVDPMDVLVAFDDRPSVIAAYRELGIVAYHTAVGY
jgi:hypothetical protein